MNKELKGNTCQKWGGEAGEMIRPRPINLPCTVHYPKGDKLNLQTWEPTDFDEIKLATGEYCRDGSCIPCQAWIVNEHMVYFKNVTGLYQHVSSLGLAPIQLRPVRLRGVDYIPFKIYKGNSNKKLYENIELIGQVGLRGYYFVPETGKIVKFVSPVK